MAFPFLSNHFQGNTALERCAVNDRDHIKRHAPGDHGDHVEKIQQALIRIAEDEPDLKAKITISQVEINSQTYGDTTAAAVLAYKTKRKIINRTYQDKADDIVGKMTIARLDDEMFAKEGHTPAGTSHAQIIQNAFDASRAMLRTVLLLLRSLDTEINNVAGLSEPEKSQALAALLSRRARDILVLSRRLITSADPLSGEFRAALRQIIDVMQRNLDTKSNIDEQGITGRCDAKLRKSGRVPFATTRKDEPDPRVSVCTPFFTMAEDFQRDAITHEFFHLLGFVDQKSIISSTREALTDPNTLTQIAARLKDRTRQIDSIGLNPDVPPLPMP
jgi:hypothetical protein